MISLAATRLIRPPARVSSSEWLQRHVVMPSGTETGGMPFSVADFPHVAGVLDAFDDPHIRRIVLQWASRLGKTTTCLSLKAMVAGTNPRNMMFASPTKDAALRVISSRLYPILRSTEGVWQQLPPESRQSRMHVKLQSCQVFVGWSGSESSLADVGAYFGTANEIDKWDESTSKEADSLPLFVNRFKGFTNHKIIFESTPTIRGRSRIEKLLQSSNQHLRYCPCPHCGEYQVLKKGDEHNPGGIKWDRAANGQSDPDVAFQTAYYECERCRGRIENHHRTAMLRRGVWVPRGCTINKDGVIEGQADKHGSDTIGFGPLASWYALTETWGNFARLWVGALRKPRDMQDVVNGYMGETWEVRRTRNQPEKIGERLATQYRRGVVPTWGRFVTVTIDRQAADGGYAKWVVLAHGPEERCHVVDFGMSVTLDELWNPILRGTYQHADGGIGVTPAAGAVDSGWDTKNTYDFCNAHAGMLPCKGSGTDMQGRPYRLATLSDSRTEADGQLLFHVNTDFWETDLQHRLDDVLPDEPGCLSLCSDAKHDMEFLVEICNGTQADRMDSRGNSKLMWMKRDESVPNDFRDAVRYGLALAAAWLEEQGGQLPERSHKHEQTRPAIINSGTRRPDGREWI